MLRVGIGYDIHRLMPGRRFVLGGVVLPAERGPLGHSDGDALLHAIVDALLGAAGLGDIGQRYPPGDPAWKDAESRLFAAETAGALRERGWRIVNIDATVVLERPKLAPHLDAMREAIAGTLGIEAGCVNVKAKTNEGLDAAGAGDAVVAHAVALLERDG